MPSFYNIDPFNLMSQVKKNPFTDFEEDFEHDFFMDEDDLYLDDDTYFMKFGRKKLSRKVRALMEIEEELVASLQDKVLEIADELVKFRIIPHTVRDILSSLDPGVSQPLRVRYILVNVFKSLNTNESLSPTVNAILFAKKPLLKEETAPHPKEISTEITAQHPKDKELEMSPFLKVGIAQHSPFLRDLPYIQPPLQRYSPFQKQSSPKPSIEVDLHSKPSFLEISSYDTTQSSSYRVDFPQYLSHFEKPFLEVSTLSSDITITEGKACLFGVKAYARKNDLFTYQWHKGDKLLQNDAFYDCTRDPILCIKRTTLDMDGSYYCRVNSNTLSRSHLVRRARYTAKSAPMNLTVTSKLDTFKGSLADLYLAQPIDLLPPDNNMCIKNVASIEYEEIFADLQDGSLLLIEGCSGSGKTSLVHKFSQDWAKNQQKLNACRFLFVVHLRVLLNDPDIQLRDIIKHYHKEASTVDQIVKHAELYKGDGLCFVLDGLNEYSPVRKENTLIFKLIRKEILPQAVVIATSRSFDTDQLKTAPTKHVKLLGFQKKQIFEYIEKYKFSDEDKAKDLQSYLLLHPNVLCMFYLPLHASLMCYLFDQISGTLPQTESEMYTIITNHLIHTSIQHESGDVKCLESKKPLHLLCKFAFEKMLSSEYIMKWSEVEPILKMISSRGEPLELIIPDVSAMKCRFQNLYAFLHLTFQEYLAACHISNMDDAKQRETIVKYGMKKHMQVVWKFYCGLVSFHHGSVFEEIVKSVQSEDDLFSIQCAFESKQSVVCDYILKHTTDSCLSFKNQFISPSDLMAIVYVMASGTSSIETLVFNRCMFQLEGANTLLEEVGEKVSSIKSLCFYNCGGRELVKSVQTLCKKTTSLKKLDLLRIKTFTYNQKETIDLVDGLKHCNNLQTLNLENNYIHADGAKALADCLKHCNSLMTLNLESNNISADGAKALADCLKNCNSLMTLNLESNNIGADGAKALADGLKHCNSLQTLNLKLNNIGSDGAKALADSLKHCNSLQTLNLESNNIGADGAKALADGLKHCNSLQTLNLGLNNIGADGVKALADGLKHCNSLQTLNLEWNKIGTDGAKALADGLKHCNSLQTLNLESNNIGVDCAKALADGLKHCNSLQTLNLESNNIDADGAKALTDGLKHCNSLQTLNLKSNNIGADGAKALADDLKHCNSLQTLNLEFNYIGADGAKDLADYLKHCNSLQTLNLKSNNIGADGAKALADCLKHCNSLQTLNLESNYIGADGAKALADGLKHCNSLQTLNLKWNKIGDDGAKALADSLKHCNSLQTLNLESNKIDTDGAKALADGLKHCNSLQTLNLKWNNIGADGAKALADGLKHCNSLQTLNLEWNNIGDDGANALADSLKHCNSLQTLNLEWNNIGDDGAKALADSLKHCNSLQTLNLEWNNIGDDGAKALADGLKHCNSLQTLNLKLNNIRADGTKALADGLKHCNNLQTLNLERNNIGANGAKALADGLKHCNSLQTLNLGLNNIGDDGAKALADGLKHCNSLQTLNLERNNIGDDGAKALADGLKHCNSLQTLNLERNNIGDDGAKALADSLKHCNSLQTLNLEWNKIGDDGAKALADGLKHCNSLQTLNLESNNIGADGAKALADGLKHCNSLQTLNLKWNNIGSDGAKALTLVMMLMVLSTAIA